MKNYNKIMQNFWLVIGILASIFAVYQLLTRDEIDPLVFFMPVLAFILFGMRRWYNGKMNKPNE